MSNGWTGDVEKTDGGEETEDAEDNGFEAKMQTFVDRGAASELPEVELATGVEEVEDEGLLKQAYRQLTGNGHDEKEGLVENRLHDLDAAIPEPEGEQSNLEGDGWGGTPVDEVDEDEEYECDECGETFDSQSGLNGHQATHADDDEDEDEADASESDEPAIESVDEMEDQNESLSGGVDESESSGLSEQSEGPPTPDGAMSVEDAADRERRWKMLVWGPPGLFKSHFCYTAPEPIAYLDLENKAHDIAHKFEDKEIQIWQPSDFHEAVEALDEALEWLDWWQEKGERGTIVVDSISLAWEWAKTAYKKEAYPMKDAEEVSLSSNIGSSQESDWAHIKGMHNDEFRDIIAQSDYHFIWTAMATEDYAAAIDDDEGGSSTPMKPEGEKNNVHKADTIIRARKDEDGDKVGDMTKSNFTDNLFIGLSRPTFPKVREVVERVESAETSERDVDKGVLEDDLGVSVVRRKP